VLAPAAMLAQDAVAELAYTAAEIAQYEFIAAGDDLDAARIAAVGAARTEKGNARSMKSSIASDVSRVRPRTASSASRILLRIADSRSGAGSEPRVSAPEAHAQWCVRIRLEAIAPLVWLGQRRPVPGRARLLDRGKDRDKMREPADRKDLVHDCVETSHGEPPLLRVSGERRSSKRAVRSLKYIRLQKSR